MYLSIQISLLHGVKNKEIGFEEMSSSKGT